MISLINPYKNEGLASIAASESRYNKALVQSSIDRLNDISYDFITLVQRMAEAGLQTHTSPHNKSLTYTLDNNSLVITINEVVPR